VINFLGSQGDFCASKDIIRSMSFSFSLDSLSNLIHGFSILGNRCKKQPKLMGFFNHIIDTVSMVESMLNN